MDIASLSLQLFLLTIMLINLIWTIYTFRKRMSNEFFDHLQNEIDQLRQTNSELNIKIQVMSNDIEWIKQRLDPDGRHRVNYLSHPD
jgi:cell division protein FtsB